MVYPNVQKPKDVLFDPEGHYFVPISEYRQDGHQVSLMMNQSVKQMWEAKTKVGRPSPAVMKHQAKYQPRSSHHLFRRRARRPIHNDGYHMC